MNKRKHLSHLLDVDIKPIDKDSEGVLVGGFALVDIPDLLLDNVTNNGCQTNDKCTHNNLCTINEKCPTNNGCTINISCTINTSPTATGNVTISNSESLYAF